MIPMIDIEDMLPEVLIYARGCPELSALKHIRDAARRFCDQVRSWRDTDVFTVSTPASEGLCSIADAAIVAIERARFDGYDLVPQTIRWLDENIDDWRSLEESSRALYITQLTPNTVTIVPKMTGALTAHLILKPSREALQLPEYLLTDHGTVIGQGAAARVLALPNTEYANPQLSLKLDADFERSISSLSRKASKGQQGARLRSRPSFF